jgi:TPR repeat protein
MFKEGKGHKVDKAAAFEYFRKSGAQGNSFAQYNLGMSFYIYTFF